MSFFKFLEHVRNEIIFPNLYRVPIFFIQINQLLDLFPSICLESITLFKQNRVLVKKRKELPGLFHIHQRDLEPFH